GSAAQHAVADGARAVGQTLSEMADTVASSTAEAGTTANTGTNAASTAVASSESSSSGGNSILPGGAAQAVAQADAGSASAQEEATGSWFGRHMLGILTAVLALLALIVAWLLRRANTKAEERESSGSGQITEEMIQEKLDRIDMDLQ